MAEGTMTVARTLSGGEVGIPLRFRVPEELHEIDLAEHSAHRAQRMFTTLAAKFRGASQAELLAAVYTQEAVLTKLANEGAVYVALCVARSEFDPSRLCLAQFTILVKESPLHGQRPMANIARGLKTPGEPREIIMTEFPAGEGLVIGEELSVRSPVTMAGRRSPRGRRVRQAQIVMAFPDRQRVAIFGVSSEHVEDWQHFTRILNSIAHTVSFASENGNSIAARLNTLD